MKREALTYITKNIILDYGTIKKIKIKGTRGYRLRDLQIYTKSYNMHSGMFTFAYRIEMVKI